MSMRDYAYLDYGLVLDEETIRYMYAVAIGGQEGLETMAAMTGMTVLCVAQMYSTMFLLVCIRRFSRHSIRI